MRVIEIVRKIKKIWPKKNIKILKTKNKNLKGKTLEFKDKKAQKELQWKPRLTLNETINLTTDWYISYYNKKDMINLTKSQIKYFLEKSNEGSYFSRWIWN